MSKMSKMLSAENVWFRYSDEYDWALQGINLQIEKGEFVAVLGSNGCGKSTLAKLFNAIILPEKGDVLVEGINTKEEEKLWNIQKAFGLTVWDCHRKLCDPFWNAIFTYPHRCRRDVFPQ